MFSKLYINSSGRCSRKFYWIFGLLPFLVLGILLGISIQVLQLNPVIVFAILLLSMWPALAMQIKRWHDMGLSGWFSLLSFLPYLGFAVGIIVGFIPGKAGVNKSGPDPLGES